MIYAHVILPTLPWTVPSPAEKRGGLGKGLTTLSRKKHIVTKTSTKGTLLNLGEGGPPGESMTPCSESRKESTSPIPFLSSQKISKIGTRNVRTMFEANKAAPIARERRAYIITVLWLCETRWTQSGQVRLNTGEIILYSGHEEEDAHHTEGVAFMLPHDAQNALISWEAAGPRIIYASFKTKKENIMLNIIQCYAPANDKDETLCDKLKEKDMKIPTGDLNAKIGSDNSGYEEVMVRQGLGKMNENGEMLADFCAFNNMIIGGSVFPHRRIHKTTWVSPDHRTENQIDHICIGRKFRRSMQDVRVQRGADAASDHHLVLARMKMKLKKREVKRSTRTQYNVDFLKDRLTTEAFRFTVRNKYEALQDLLDEGNMDIDTQWQQIKEMWTSTCSDVLGKKKYQQKDRISTDTQQSASEEGKEKCN